jgi:hypothetical protein
MRGRNGKHPQSVTGNSTQQHLLAAELQMVLQNADSQPRNDAVQ